MLQGDNNVWILRRDKRLCHSSGEGCSWPLSSPEVSRGEQRYQEIFVLGKQGAVQPLSLVFSQHLEGREAAVIVGRIPHHCGAPSPAAFLLPQVELCS